MLGFCKDTVNRCRNSAGVPRIRKMRTSISVGKCVIDTLFHGGAVGVQDTIFKNE